MLQDRAELALGWQNNIHHSLVSGSNFYFLAALYFSLLDLLSLLQSLVPRACKQDSQEGQNKELQRNKNYCPS